MDAFFNFNTLNREYEGTVMQINADFTKVLNLFFAQGTHISPEVMQKKYARMKSARFPKLDSNSIMSVLLDVAANTAIPRNALQEFNSGKLSLDDLILKYYRVNLLGALVELSQRINSLKPVDYKAARVAKDSEFKVTLRKIYGLKTRVE